ncbi:MAG: aldo/keto reductase [Armatimonadota bacterium]|nr:MAG: aldo/keto reductase [Armatimonadota bacterium]
MKKISLGNSDIQITRFCLGTWNMAGGPGWGPEGEEAGISLIRHALDRGCNFVDTARVYGSGKSEQVVGKAVQGRRDQVIIATKMMHCKPEEVGPYIAESLDCLRTDYVDLYICHWPFPSLPLEPFFEEMVRQRESGKIRAVGVSNFDLEQMRIALNYGVVSLQPPLSILWRIPHDLLDFCRENNVAVTPYSPLAQGLLTGRYTRRKTDSFGGPREGNLLFSEAMLPHSLQVASLVDGIADSMGSTSAQVSLAWLLQTPGITSVIVGASSTEQCDQNLGALDVTLSEEDYSRLDEAGRAVWDRLGPDETMWGWKPT